MSLSVVGPPLCGCPLRSEVAGLRSERREITSEPIGDICAMPTGCCSLPALTESAIVLALEAPEATSRMVLTRSSTWRCAWC